MEDRQLHNIKMIFKTQKEQGYRTINLNIIDFEWLLQQAEKAEHYEKALEQVHELAISDGKMVDCEFVASHSLAHFKNAHTN